MYTPYDTLHLYHIDMRLADVNGHVEASMIPDLTRLFDDLADTTSFLYISTLKSDLQNIGIPVLGPFL